MHRTMRTGVLRSLLILTVLSSFSLGTSVAAEKDSRPLLFVGFSGSYYNPGWISKLDTTAGYRFNSHFEVSAGIPVYFVRVSDETSSGGDYESKAGIGNFYADLRVMTEASGFYISSSLRGTAPTGNKEEGFSTGRATLDWNNYLEYSAGRWTPFGSAGIANSVSDTHFLTRPYSSLGIVGQFEGGVLFHPAWWFDLGGSGYSVVPSGEQKIYSRMFGKRMSESDTDNSDTSSSTGRQRRIFEENNYTVVDAEIVKDYGFSGWADFYPSENIVLGIGYNRSVAFEYNTLFFSARFNLAGMISKGDD